jgi:hypothetical protein
MILMNKNLETPIMDAARAQQQALWDQMAAMPPLRWYTLRYWLVWFYCWRHGL